MHNDKYRRQLMVLGKTRKPLSQREALPYRILTAYSMKKREKERSANGPDPEKGRTELIADHRVRILQPLTIVTSHLTTLLPPSHSSGEVAIWAATLAPSQARASGV